MEEGTESGEEGQAGPTRRLTRGPADRSGAVELAAAAVLALWLTRSFWLPGRYVVGFDTVAYSGPNMEVTTDAWRAGRLPLWNEYIFGGVTHLGNPQAGALYPPRVLGLLFETNRAMGLLVALHVVVLAVGTVLLVRRLGCRPPAGFAAALVVCAGGAVTTRTLQFEQILVFAWAPLLLLGITAVLADAERRSAALAGTGAVTAMILLAGHPQIVYQLVVVALVWTAALVWRDRPWRRLGDLAIALAAGAAVAAPQLAAALAATRDSAIGIGRTLRELESPALSARPDHLAQILLGSVRRVDQAEFAGGFEAIGHVGVAAAVLAVAGLVWGARRRELRAEAVAMALLAVLGVVWALGPRTPLFTAGYDWLPGFDLARASGRWLDVTALAAGVGAALAIEAVRRRGRLTAGLLAAGVMFLLVLALGALDAVLLADRGTVVSWVVLAALTVAVLAVPAWPDRPDQPDTPDQAGVPDRAAWRRRWRPEWSCAAVVALVAVELLGSLSVSAVDVSVESAPFTDSVGGAAAGLRGEAGLSIARTDDAFGDIGYLVAGFRPNTNVLAGVPSLDGYDGGVQVTDRFAALGARLAPDVPAELPLRNKLPLSWTPDDAARLGVRWAVLDVLRDAAVQLPGWTPTDREDGRFAVWENPRWVAEAVLRRDGRDVALGFVRRSPTRLEVAVTDGTGTSGGQVLVFRQGGPGWRVRVDGETADLVAVDGFYLGVDVPAGAEEVVFEYRPGWLRPSLVLSAAGVAWLLVMAALGWARRLSVKRSG